MGRKGKERSVGEIPYPLQDTNVFYPNLAVLYLEQKGVGLWRTTLFQDRNYCDRPVPDLQISV